MKGQKASLENPQPLNSSSSTIRNPSLGIHPSLSPLYHFFCSLFIHTNLTMASPSTTTGLAKVDAVVQTALSKTPEKLSGIALYSRFALAGAVCCSVTHGALTPVDV